eukprot:7518094-Karenia_brevis.AAC.1
MQENEEGQVNTAAASLRGSRPSSERARGIMPRRLCSASSHAYGHGGCETTCLAKPAMLDAKDYPRACARAQAGKKK